MRDTGGSDDGFMNSGRESPSISAVVYSLNEADLLEACLDRLAGFDEIVVCDMQSTDATREVAGRFGARVVEVPRARVVEQVRQLGIDAARSEWVLFVDADEHLPADFATELRGVIRTRPEVVAWRIGYVNVAFGRRLDHVLQGSAKFSLVRCDRTRYPAEGRAHVPPDFDGPTADAMTLVSRILHLNFRSPAQTVEKALRYAPDVQASRALLTPGGLLVAGTRRLILTGAWRDGIAGCAVVTAGLFGDWYAALLAAEREDLLDADTPARQQRALGAVVGAHHVAIAVRDRVRRLARRTGR